MAEKLTRQVPTLKVKQWLKGWDEVDFNAEERRARPLPHFYIFSIPARELRSLSGIWRREAAGGSARTADLGIQRQHDAERSDEINRFVRFGFPWSTLSEARRLSREFDDLRKPGWLPTAIIVNILGTGNTRNGASVAPEDIISIDETTGNLKLPYQTWSPKWRPREVPPLEVIDGQHRLWAFDDDMPEDFELPVVAFCELDLSWQAYLFWTINIKPKRINPSLAFDLYPLLRAEDWLDRAEGHSIYRETRSQELTEALWSHPESPWYDKINMLGERQSPWVTQSAWIKSLVSTLVRPWEGRRGSTGGVFGGRLEDTDEVLGWSRGQQAAFLIYAWQALLQAVKSTRATWTTDLRTAPPAYLMQEKLDAAFYGPHSLINSDQGVRGYLHVLNDLVYMSAAKYKLNTWEPGETASASDLGAVSRLIESLEKQEIAKFLIEIAKQLAAFDWRTGSTPGLSDEQRRAKLVFRGSSGYREMRAQLLEHLAEGPHESSSIAKRLLGRG